MPEENGMLQYKFITAGVYVFQRSYFLQGATKAGKELRFCGIMLCHLHVKR